MEIVNKIKGIEKVGDSKILPHHNGQEKFTLLGFIAGVNCKWKSQPLKKSGEHAYNKDFKVCKTISEAEKILSKNENKDNYIQYFFKTKVIYK